MADRDTLQALYARGPSLQLGTADLCFLAALTLRSSAIDSATFAEDVLFDVHAELERALEDSSEPSRARATAAIRRLRAQRLLTRVDGAGLRRAGEYALSRLALGIVDFFLEEDVLTRQSLALLLGALAERLGAVHQEAAQIEQHPEEVRDERWAAEVVLPLQVTISDLVAGIERRQRGFDLQQEEFQRRVTSLLRADWFGAVAQCEKLLQETSDTLRELYMLLLREGQQLASVLLELQELASTAGDLPAARTAEREARRLSGEVDRMNAWGAERQRAWAEYHEQVHRYLRDVVRLDPSRALIDRIRQAMNHSGRRYSLTVAASAPCTTLRAVALPPAAKPPVRREKRKGELTPQTTDASDPQRELDAKVEEALRQGARTLSSLTRELTGSAEEQGEGPQFAAAGRIAQTVGRLAKALDARAEREWSEVSDSLWVEEWKASG